MRKSPFLTRTLAGLVTSLLLLGSSLAGDAASFEAATQAYRDGKFEEAKAAYQALLTKEPTASGYYNLGNAAYRLGEKGEAMLAWERALALDPSLAEASSNLKRGRDEAGAQVESSGPKWQQAVEWPYKTFGQYAVWGGILGFWILCFGLAPALWGRNISGLAVGFGLIAFALLGGSAAWAWQQPSVWVVTADKVEARQAPVDASKLEGVFPVGSRLRLLRESGEWLQMQLPKGEKGWVPKGSVAPVIPE